MCQNFDCSSVNNDIFVYLQCTYVVYIQDPNCMVIRSAVYNDTEVSQLCNSHILVILPAIVKSKYICMISSLKRI